MASGAFVGILQHIKVRQALEGPAAGGLRSNGGGRGPPEPRKRHTLGILGRGKDFCKTRQAPQKKKRFLCLDCFLTLA